MLETRATIRGKPFRNGQDDDDDTEDDGLMHDCP